MLAVTKNKEINFFIDGASQGNPGHSGIGIVVVDIRGESIKEISEYIGEVTNNVAEYTALNFALAEALILKSKNISIKSDSELLVKQLNGEYKVKSNNIKSLYLQAKHLIKGFNNVKIDYIQRTKNKEADKLAKLAIRKRKK